MEIRYIPFLSDVIPDHHLNPPENEELFDEDGWPLNDNDDLYDLTKYD